MNKENIYQTNNGRPYTMVRKVKWDHFWHLGWQQDDGEWSYDRVDKKTALKVAEKIS